MFVMFLSENVCGEVKISHSSCHFLHRILIFFKNKEVYNTALTIDTILFFLIVCKSSILFCCFKCLFDVHTNEGNSEIKKNADWLCVCVSVFVCMINSFDKVLK